jgi:hypothetical protein
MNKSYLSDSFNFYRKILKDMNKSFSLPPKDYGVMVSKKRRKKK